jgi:alkylhydroperoxidase family enzyme
MPRMGEANYERAFAARPDVYRAWRELLTAIRANMDPRRYELATFAAAQRLRSSYCSLAHGSELLRLG